MVASAEMITGEFLRIALGADEVTIDMTINNTVERIEIMNAPAITALKDLYPNPFNPDINISYALEEEGEVIIQVYNLKGQLIETLVNELQSAGDHLIQWKADNQASGVYFCQMKFGHFSTSKKVILMK